jgi:hypothetical protein
MIVQTFAGWIDADTILQHENIGAWALGWLNRAQKSEAQGKTLVVFEVPRKTSVKFIEELEAHTVELCLELGVDPGATGSAAYRDVWSPID